MLYTSLKIICVILVLHPLIYISNNKEYKAYKKDKKSLYLETDYLSIISTNSIFIIGSIFLYLAIFFTNYFWLKLLFGLPLTLITYCCFIRDRFKSLARGCGAPGYICFLCVCTILTSEITNLISQNIALAYEFKLLIEVLFIILYLEFGYIFLSSGLFKIIASNKEPLSTALSFLNPIWSKYYKKIGIIQNLRCLLNWSAALGQFFGGILILSFFPFFQKIGFLIIALMFFSITPFYRLSWLCPSIAFMSLINYSLIDLVNSLNKEIIFFVFILRGLLCSRLFLEYFKGWGYTCWLEKNFLGLYRKIFGIVIWRVFTFDIVKVIAPTSPLLNLESNMKNNYNFEVFCEVSEKTNAYECVTLIALINSRKYLKKELWFWKVNRYLEVKGRKEICWIECEKEKAYKKYKKNSLGPYAQSKFFSQSYENDIEIKDLNKKDDMFEYTSN